MRLGCCASYEQGEACKAVGFDFVEEHIQRLLKGEEDETAWAASAPNIDVLALPIEAANCLVPGSLPVVGPKRDFEALTKYIGRVVERAAKLGIAYLVFGSGGARKRPAGFDEDETFEQLLEFTQMTGDACGKHGVVLVIEHLKHGESNTLNMLEDCMKLHDAVNHEAVEMLVDSFHYGQNNEQDDALLAIGNHLKHVHISEPIDRIEPGGHDDPDKSFDFEHFFTLCRKLGYDDCVSLECKWSRPMEEVGRDTVAYIRDAWNRAGS